MQGARALLGCLAGCLLAVAPAYAAESQGELVPAGSIQISWHGDTARGCEAAGVCGYSGSVSVTPGGGDVNLPGFAAEGQLDVANVPVVRVDRGEGDQARAVCVDRLALQDLGLSFAPAGGGRVTPQLFAFDSIGAGRCAGPALDAAFEHLHAPALRRSRLLGHLLDLRGSAHYGSGPFAIDVASTLTARVTRIPSDDIFGTNERSPGSAPRVVRKRYAVLAARYEVRRLSGRTRIAFAGLPGPRCLPFDSCSVEGTATYSFDVRRRSMWLDASVRVPRAARHPRRLMLRALRSGHARVQGFTGMEERPPRVATTALTVTRPGGATCTDVHKVAIPALAIAGRGRTLPAVIGGRETEGLPEIAGSFCPGPLEEDVVGDGSLARTRLAARALLRRRLRLDLSGSRTVGGPGYTGSTASDYVLLLRRRSLRIHFQTADGERP